MTARRRKKNSRQRGTHTHGWGSKKKHRGAGNRGGKGMAGTGKRGDAKKPSIWKKKYFGKHGFKKKNKGAKIRAISIKTIEQKLPLWVSSKIAEDKGGLISVDLEKAGYNKILSNGNAKSRLNLKVLYASASAVEKIKAAGGGVSGLAKTGAEKQAPESAGKEKEEGVE
jgi:large subunit ribosomal protein L15